MQNKGQGIQLSFCMDKKLSYLRKEKRNISSYTYYKLKRSSKDYIKKCSINYLYLFTVLSYKLLHYKLNIMYGQRLFIIILYCFNSYTLCSFFYTKYTRHITLNTFKHKNSSRLMDSVYMIEYFLFIIIIFIIITIFYLFIYFLIFTHLLYMRLKCYSSQQWIVWIAKL